MSLAPHLAALRDEALRTTCEQWAMRHRWPLSRGIDRSGPCPKCGGDDRFSIHTKKNLFLCRVCGIEGGGVIDLVRQVNDLGFVAACELITGRKAEEPVNEKKAAQLAEQTRRDAERREREADRYREKAREDGYAIWRRGQPITGDCRAVVDYLTARGVGAAVAYLSKASVRVIPEHPRLEKQGGTWVELHRGPAMIAAVQMPDDKFGAVHQTWLDPSQPKGRLDLPPNDQGKKRPSKMMRGTKSGGAIRLYTPPEPKRIVMGEGIESTLTPLAHAFEPDTAYWAGVDLGHMAGKALRDSTGAQVHDQPDMDDPECFVPPEWCTELVYLEEGDDPRRHSHEKLLRGCRRAMRLRPGLKAYLVPAPGPGMDMNDLVLPGREVEG